MAIKVTLTPRVTIDPIPTGADGIVRGKKVTVKGTAECVKETHDTTNPEKDTSEDSPESITEVAVRLGSAGSFVKANPTGPVSSATHQKTWTTWTTDERDIVGVVNNKLTITARVSAGVGAQLTRDTALVAVSVDRTPPD